MLLVDAHVHIATPERMAANAKWMKRLLPEFSESILTSPEPAGLVGALREAGVGAVFNFAFPLKPGKSREENRWNAALADQYPHVFPFASIHAGDDDPVGVLAEGLDELNMVGLKIHTVAQRFGMLEPSILPVYEELNRRKGLAVFHTGYSKLWNTGREVEEFRDVLEQYRDTTLIAAHMLWGDISLDELDGWLADFPNLYLDTAAVMTLSSEAELASLREFVGVHSERMLIGTDYPMVVCPLDQAYERAWRCCPTHEAMRNLAGLTALKLMKRFAPERLERLVAVDPNVAAAL